VVEGKDVMVKGNEAGSFGRLVVKISDSCD
jgi:hypothetical protein